MIIMIMITIYIIISVQNLKIVVVVLDVVMILNIILTILILVEVNVVKIYVQNVVVIVAFVSDRRSVTDPFRDSSHCSTLAPFIPIRYTVKRNYIDQRDSAQHAVSFGEFQGKRSTLSYPVTT